ncbi:MULTISPECIES: hypothetical protein [Halomonas]|uniref:Uncharacterized protein n=1 Tax=Halomonas halophila TaxID=29573 RepID=A0ABQ0U469_9GAMM|nr:MULTISPECIES: hypothetical protein [Halomonas]MDR5890680.1 hypothetical protein [Halomonas salina]WJY07603.1 hypothetical protein QWG60_01555 [Halomonas halophila]GEK73235.1 hypothetical protein HHA04nite_17790 [Halomonas halophila]
MRRPTTALLASLLLPLALPSPAMADDIRHGPVVYGTGETHQHGPAYYGNGPDDRETPGRYRTHPRETEPRRHDSATPLIIVEPRIDLDDRWRPHDPRPRHPHGPRRIDRDRVGKSHWFIEPNANSHQRP